MPRLTIVIGGNGAGKTTWTRRHRNELPPRFYNADSIAAGLGDWNREERQREAREIVDKQIAAQLKAKNDFGFESTYSGRSRPAIVDRASAGGYDVHACFLGTENAEINVRRVRARTMDGSGHAVNPSEIRRRWQASQDNLARTFRSMNALTIIDNTGDNAEIVLTIQANQIVTERAPAPRWVREMTKRLALRPGPPHPGRTARKPKVLEQRNRNVPDGE